MTRKLVLTFEGEDFATLRTAIEDYLLAAESFAADMTEAKAKWTISPRLVEKLKMQEAAAPPKPEKKPEPKPDAAERMAKARAAKAKKKAPEPVAQHAKEVKPLPAPEAAQLQGLEDYPAFEDLKLEQPEPEPEPDPTKLAALRVKTTEDLQAAYSSGKHKQVLALLSKYGNGAKSFRELQIQDFVPIRKAIDEGALA